MSKSTAQFLPQAFLSSAVRNNHSGKDEPQKKLEKDNADYVLKLKAVFIICGLILVIVFSALEIMTRHNHSQVVRGLIVEGASLFLGWLIFLVFRRGARNAEPDHTLVLQSIRNVAKHLEMSEEDIYSKPISELQAIVDGALENEAARVQSFCRNTQGFITRAQYLQSTQNGRDAGVDKALKLEIEDAMKRNDVEREGFRSMYAAFSAAGLTTRDFHEYLTS